MTKSSSPHPICACTSRLMLPCPPGSSMTPARGRSGIITSTRAASPVRVAQYSEKIRTPLVASAAWAAATRASDSAGSRHHGVIGLRKARTVRSWRGSLGALLMVFPPKMIFEDRLLVSQDRSIGNELHIGVLWRAHFAALLDRLVRFCRQFGANDGFHIPHMADRLVGGQQIDAAFLPDVREHRRHRVDLLIGGDPDHGDAAGLEATLDEFEKFPGIDVVAVDRGRPQRIHQDHVVLRR